VVVIGAGIVGSAIAMHLAERDLRPVLVAPDPAEQTTSARSFASISAFGTDPVGYYELACTALARWSKWAQRLGEVGFRVGGQLRRTADPQQGRRLALQVERARSRGYPIVPVDESDLRQLLPAAEPGPVAAACHAPWDGQVEPELVVAACRAATQATGGRLLLGTRAGVRLDDAGLRVEVGDLVLRPQIAVLAAGAESVTVARTVGLDVPTLASPGLLVETEPLPASSRPCTPVAISSATSGPSTGASVTPLWVTARYRPSRPGSGPRIGSRSVGIDRQASSVRAIRAPRRTGRKRAAWPSSAWPCRWVRSWATISWERSPSSTEPSGRCRRWTCGPGPPGR
jgi:glycine/D-amino acid oxidase-like deaminating enzyme